MNRVMILGCCGAGKSTFAKRLHHIIGLDVIHLDQHYWKANWEESAVDEWTDVVKTLAEKPSWIIDGNYGGTVDIRMNRADTIIYLDYSTFRCLWRITKRTLQYKGRSRPDMTVGCNERFDLAFYHYAATYNLVKRKKLLAKLDALREDKQILIFSNDREVDRYFVALAGGV